MTKSAKNCQIPLSSWYFGAFGINQKGSAHNMHIHAINYILRKIRDQKATQYKQFEAIIEVSVITAEGKSKDFCYLNSP